MVRSKNRQSPLKEVLMCPKRAISPRFQTVDLRDLSSDPNNDLSVHVNASKVDHHLKKVMKIVTRGIAPLAVIADHEAGQSTQAGAATRTGEDTSIVVIVATIVIMIVRIVLVKIAEIETRTAIARRRNDIIIVVEDVAIPVQMIRMSVAGVKMIRMIAVATVTNGSITSTDPSLIFFTKLMTQTKSLSAEPHGVLGFWGFGVLGLGFRV